MMNNLNVIGLNPAVAGRITPMVEDLLREHASNIHSFHLVGSAVIPDYNEKLSDINSVLVLKAMDLRVLAFLAPLGKKYGRKRIAAPLVMTPEYIESSLDAFPVEFLDFKHIHKTVYGHDLLQGLRAPESGWSEILRGLRCGTSRRRLPPRSPLRGRPGSGLPEMRLLRPPRGRGLRRLRDAARRG